jgi:D-alanyl-D-alanine carboxypeptidase-like protein
MTSLSGALPQIQNAFNALQQYGASQGISIGVADFGGIRTQADTTRIIGYRQDDFNAAVRAGTIPADTALNAFRPIAPFGRSYHNYGAAFDVAILARPAGMSEFQALATLGAYAPSIGLRWGGTFPTNKDFPHFELAVPLSQAQSMYEQIGGTAGRAPGGLGLPSLSDLASFLPSLTPMTDDSADDEVLYADPAGFPPVGDYASDDSGDALLMQDVGGGGYDSTLLMLGAVVAGVVLWAIRRQFR